MSKKGKNRKMDTGKSMCSKKLCYCENRECDYLHKQYAMKKWVFWIIITVIFLGAIVPFLAEAICAIWCPSRADVIGTWNQFVSIVLGIVATLLSIVSIIMGFKNYEDTLHVQEKYMMSFHELSIIAKDLSHLKNNVDRVLDGYKVDSANKDPGSWGNDPKDTL